MHKFKTAKRTADERTAHKEKLNEVFARIGSKGKIDRRGLKELNDNRFEVAETIVSLISDELTVVDPTSLLLEQKDIAFVDKQIFQHLEGTLSVVNRSYGSKPLTQRLTASETTFSTSMKEINVALPLEELVGGRITASQIVDAMAFAIARFKVSMALDAIDSYITATADNTGATGYQLRYSGITRANLEKAVDGLRDDGETPTIFGRYIAMFPALRGFTGWGIAATDSLQQRGVVDTFNGAPIVTLADKYSRLTGGHQIAADRIWVAAGTKGGYFVEKDVSFLNYSFIDERTSTFETGLRIENGVYLFDRNKYRVITA